MAVTAQEIADLLQRNGSGADTSRDDEARQRRAGLLVPVLAACREACASGSHDIDAIAEKLGDGSRDVAWRAPLGDSGMLDFFLGILSSSGAGRPLQTHILRLVGNSCADTDENRARVVEGGHLAAVIDQLQYPSLIPYTIPVLFNIMVDYEPAQLLASQSHLNQHLTKILSTDVSEFAVFVPYMCKILALLITQECEPALANPDTVSTLLKLAMAKPARDDVDGFVALVSVTAAYLAHEAFQLRTITEPAHMELFMSVFHHVHTHLDETTQGDTDDDDDDTAEQVRDLRSSLLLVLADTTGHDEFATLHPLESPVSQTLLSWLRSADPRLQAAACLALGNLSRSDAVSLSLAQTHLAHEPLLTLLSDQTISDAQLLHAALSFLKNLAVPAQNKPRLVALLDPSCVPRVLAVQALPQVQFAAISLTRLLLVGCPATVARVCAPPPDSALDGILSLFRRSDAEPTRLEAARAVAAVCRVVHATPPELPEQRACLHLRRPDVAEALAFLVTQDKWPVLRSEAWFVFALMCRAQDGAGTVAQVLLVAGVVEALSQAVTETLQGPKEEVDMDGLQLERKPVDPKQRESIQRVDRENALVMCTELLRTLRDEMPDSTAAMLRDLVNTGTEMVVAQKSADQSLNRA